MLHSGFAQNAIIFRINFYFIVFHETNFVFGSAGDRTENKIAACYLFIEFSLNAVDCGSGIFF